MQLVLRDGESDCLLRGQRVGRGDVGHRAHGNVRHPGGLLQHGAGLPPPGQGQTITIRVYHIYPHGHCLPPDGAMRLSQPHDGAMCKSQSHKSPGGSQKMLFYTFQPSKTSQCLHFVWLKNVKKQFLATTRTFAWQGLTCGAIWR